MVDVTAIFDDAGMTIGWVAMCPASVGEMKEAVAHAGIDVDWPRHTIVEIIPAKLHCARCGFDYADGHDSDCGHDEYEGWSLSLGCGGPATVIMRDGGSILDHVRSRRLPRPTSIMRKD